MFFIEDKIRDIVAQCDSLTIGELERLDQWQIDVIHSVDTNWCYEENIRSMGFHSVGDAISAAIYAAYEQVTCPYASEDNY